MTNRLPLTLSVLAVAAGTAVALFAQGGPADAPDPFELRRLVIDRVEAAYSAGDTATLMRMAGMEPPPLTGRARTDQLLAEAFDEMLREIDEAWEARARELAGAPRARVEPEEDAGF